MSIAGMNRKDKMLIGLILILIGTLVAGATSLHSAWAGNGLSIESVVLPAGGQVVASKNGAKYYLPWCGAAARITEGNRVWFASPEEAKTAGYGPAANCKGL